MAFKKHLFSLYGITLAICFGLFSCSEKTDLPDVSSINANVNLIRFDVELFDGDTNQWNAELTALRNKYPAFCDLYFKHILPLTPDSAAYDVALKSFVSDRDIKKLYDTTQVIMGELKSYQDELTLAVKYIKYHYPQFEEPNVYTFISEYGYQRFIFQDGNKNGIGIGLDMFLGSSYPYKSIDPANPNFSAYLTRTFDKEYLVKKTVDLLVEDLLGEPPGARLLDQMVHNGKKLYFLKKFMPETADSILFEYSKNQLEWVQSNEMEIWSFLLDQNMVYETNFNKINKYINPSPESPGMPREAPGQTANYIGYRMVESFMQQSPQYTLEKLATFRDAQKLMEVANYKPSRKK
ncbi:MAG: hypothetical protein IPN29_05100 [Saprospiraceae bacterium]|nr:hypothetical protein [Saprospiraceae bacterium]